MSIPDIRKIEKWFLNILILIIISIKDYIAITYKILTNPARNIQEIIYMKSNYTISPLLYFIINITLTYVISSTDFTIFKVVQEAFDKTKPTLGDFISEFFSYFLGIVLFVVLYQYKNSKYSNLNNITTVILLNSIFYASAIFIPLVFIDKVIVTGAYQVLFYRIFMNLDGFPVRGNSSFFSNSGNSANNMALSSTGDDLQIMGDLNFIFFMGIPIILYIGSLIWWSCLIYIGNNMSNGFSKAKFIKKISYTLLIFIVIQFFLKISLAPEKNWQVIVALYLKQSIVNELEHESPRYGNIAMKYWYISASDSVPKVLRYESLVSSIIYALAAYDNKQPLFVKTKKYIDDSEYDLAYTELNTAVENSLIKKTPKDPSYDTLNYLSSLLLDAKKYRDDTDYKPSERTLSTMIETNNIKDRRLYFKLIP